MVEIIKRNYLLSLIVIGLISLSLYSTYAMFTSSVETDDIVSMNTIMNYTFKINGTQNLKVSPNSKLRFNAIIENDMTGAISYGLYYKMIVPETLPSDVVIAEVTNNSSLTTSGTINENSQIVVPLVIKNNSDIEVNIEIGIVPGYATETQGVNQLIYENGQIPITEKISPEEVGDDSCSSTIKCTEECKTIIENGMQYNKCYCYVGDGTEIVNKDTSGANTPDLVEGLIPITYKENKWVKADETNGDIENLWYDYNAQKWANAVLVNNSSRSTYQNASVGTEVKEADILAYYVWIPRYKYKLFNAKKVAGTDSYNARTKGIDIVFENGEEKTGTVTCSIANNGTESCSGATNGAYYTHPAFTFGSIELNGIWVGKFELTGNTTTPTVKPNVSSLRNINVSTISNTIAKISGSSNSYGVNSSKANSHMMKNMEWGAVAYLTNSKYGRCPNGTCTEIGINNNSNFTTGCGAAPGSGSSSSCNAYTTANGMLASTTKNTYGVYDLSGGAYEYVMGNMVNSSGGFYSRNSGFSNAPESKYYDKYPYNTTNTAGTRGHLGDATSEVVASGYTGWNNDYAYFVSSSFPWFHRGGCYGNGSSAGAFYFDYNDGNAGSSYSGRAVLVRLD